MRFIGLDVHRDFCEVAIAEAGKVRLAGRVRTEPEALALFAQSLGGDDEVALEATGNALGIAPDEQTRVLRRRISARAQLVGQRTRAKNQVQATLIRNLKGKPPVGDLFGVRGRRW